MSPEASPPFIALQRVVVRMLFDPSFVRRVYDRPDEALAGLEIDAGLVRELMRNDRRLWNADRLRRSRALKVLMEEFKATSTLVLAERGKIEFLDGFFGSSFFHAAVQTRGYMALAFAAYLEDAVQAGLLRSAHLRAALGLEAAMARSRRQLRDARRGRDAALAPVAPGRPGVRWAVRPGVSVHRAPGGVIALAQHIEKYLFGVSQVPALALCDDAPRPEPLPDLGEATPRTFLLEPRLGGKVDLSEVGGDYAALVEACLRPTDAEELAARLLAEGTDPLTGSGPRPKRSVSEAADMAKELLEAEVLRRVHVDADGGVEEISG